MDTLLHAIPVNCESAQDKLGRTCTCLANSLHANKSVLFKHISTLLQEIRDKCGLSHQDPSWIFDDATFEKMGAMMYENGSRLLGIYDELSAFLTKINIFKGPTLSDSHEFSQFLQLYNGHGWRKDTGMMGICHC